MNSLDPQTTNDGKPYGPIRYKEIVKERWFIAKQAHIGYSDTAEMTPIERTYIMEFIQEEYQKTKEAIEQRQAELKAQKGVNKGFH